VSARTTGAAVSFGRTPRATRSVEAARRVACSKPKALRFPGPLAVSYAFQGVFPGASGCHGAETLYGLDNLFLVVSGTLWL